MASKLLVTVHSTEVALAVRDAGGELQAEYPDAILVLADDVAAAA